MSDQITRRRFFQALGASALAAGCALPIGFPQEQFEWSIRTESTTGYCEGYGYTAHHYDEVMEQYWPWAKQFGHSITKIAKRKSPTDRFVEIYRVKVPIYVHKA